MEPNMTTVTEGTQPIPLVTAPQPENIVPTTDITKHGPSFWRLKFRPTLSNTPTHDDRKSQLMFDVLFSGAKADGKWEDDWPLMAKEDFLKDLKAISDLEIGGHRHDGTHPRSKSKE